jgi:hypothetical protein
VGVETREFLSETESEIHSINADQGDSSTGVE